MNNKKLITQLTDEELAELISKGDNILPNEIQIVPRTDVMEFVSFYNLKSGDERIPVRLLYKLYNKWSEVPLTRRQFSGEMNQLFQSIEYGGGKSVICLNKETKQLKMVLESFFNKVKQDKTKQKGYKKHFDNFIDHYKLMKGSLYIKDKVLYNLYDKWTYKGHIGNPLSFRNFVKCCRVYYKQDEKYIAGHYWFSMDHTIVNHLSPEMLDEMNERYNEKTKKVKKISK